MKNQQQIDSEKPLYDPSDKEKKRIEYIYNEFDIMDKERKKARRYFNDRTLKEFIDDGEKRATGYVLTKSEQGKEDWQANFFHPVTRNKTKAIIAAVAHDVPKMRIKAQNNDGKMDSKRAEVIKHLVKYSYNQEDIETEFFFECWENAIKGTVIVYDGYQKIKRKFKEITSVDITSGEVTWEEKEEVSDEKCVDFIVPLENIYIKDFFIRDIQDQPGIIWLDYYNKEQLKTEFGGYKNFEYIKAGGELTTGEEKTYFSENWKNRTEDEDGYEILRYFNTFTDEYMICINGVMVLDIPMLWEMNNKKIYPFAKTPFEPFDGKFFYGNSLPNTLMGEQDVINTLFNMSVDKTYRSMVPPLLIGEANRDMFDLEDEEYSQDTKIYVDDIAQVKQMEIQGITSGDVKMIDIISRGLDVSSVDANQQGVTGKGVTAREVVIANENARKLRGLFYGSLKSLWYQKVKLRMMNILTYYTMPKISGVLDSKELVTYKKFMVEDTQLSDGSSGTLGIQMVGDKKKLPRTADLDVEEEEYRQQGINYEGLAITKDYLDHWDYDVTIMTEDLHQSEQSTKQAFMLEKIKMMATVFPQIFKQNREKIFKDYVKTFGDNPDDYQIGQQEQEQAPLGAEVKGPNPADASNPNQLSNLADLEK